MGFMDFALLLKHISDTSLEYLRRQANELVGYVVNNLYAWPFLFTSNSDLCILTMTDLNQVSAIWDNLYNM